jgi:hypothetical protein
VIVELVGRGTDMDVTYRMDKKVDGNRRDGDGDTNEEYAVCLMVLNLLIPSHLSIPL